MLLAQSNLHAAQDKIERAALEDQLTSSHVICTSFYQECVRTLQEARPAGLKLIDKKIERSTARGLSMLLETLLDWTLHHLRVLSTKCTQDAVLQQNLQRMLMEAQVTAGAEKVAHCRASSELLEAQSQIMALTKSSEKERAEAAEICSQLMMSQKELKLLVATTAKLEQEMQAIYDHFGQVLNDDFVKFPPHQPDTHLDPVQSDNGVMPYEFGARHQTAEIQFCKFDQAMANLRLTTIAHESKQSHILPLRPSFVPQRPVVVDDVEQDSLELFAKNRNNCYCKHS